MDTISEVIARYTGQTLTSHDLAAADDAALRPALSRALVHAAHELGRLDAELGEVNARVLDKTIRVTAALNTPAGRSAPSLNPIGELQANAARFDALIAERQARISHLHTLVALFNLLPAPASPSNAADAG
jgi:hypothetical protein